ncbi:organ-specific protein, partial [Klebsiella pneumoniae]|uniref:organ-specific protein n=1 Tax=Klebsiella pneumoniae TaxID=573 RepID=UPI0037A6F7FC
TRNMYTKAFFVFSTVLSLLLLFANTIDARKDLGLRDIWRIAMKNQDMTESIQVLIPKSHASTVSKTDPNCNEDSEHQKAKMSFAKNFELMPDLSIYDNRINPTKQKTFAKNFKLMPDVSIFDNGINPTKQKSFAKNFELMPDLSIYEPTKQKSMVSNLDLNPDASIYHN